MAIDRMPRGAFGSVTFTKDGVEIKNAANKKAKALRKKAAERRKRIEAACTTKGLTAADLIANANNIANYAPSSTMHMTVGEQGQVREEAAHMNQELSEAETLELLARNINIHKDHELSFDELAYLGF